MTKIGAPRHSGAGTLSEKWRDHDGLAVELHPDHPLALPLRRLLLKLETAYRLPKLMRKYEVPSPPPLQQWKGDRSSLFGNQLATTILASIGTLGWTFEGLCVAAATGYDRVVVKKAVRSLEQQGILVGDRARRPGFNVRTLKIDPGFVASNELELLVREYVRAWPHVSQRIEHELNHMSPRTLEQLHRRQLPITPLQESARPRSLSEPWPSGRAECLKRYFALTRKHRKTLSSHELIHLDSNLYRSIRRCWPAFSAFREEAGLQPVMTGKNRQPNALLREDCIEEYFSLSKKLGHFPNTSEMNKICGWLVQRITTQWGGINAFYEEMKVFPARRSRSAREDENKKRADCRQEYAALQNLLGHPPSSWELLRHTGSLTKRILRNWPSFERFCDDIGVSPPRRRAVSEDGRKRWVSINSQSA